LDCCSTREIEEQSGVPYKTAQGWLGEKVKSGEFAQPPTSRQHFDIWQFASADKDVGSQSYFGAVLPQVLENLLWFYTEPGEIVVPQAGPAHSSLCRISMLIASPLCQSRRSATSNSVRAAANACDLVPAFRRSTGPRSLVDKMAMNSRPIAVIIVLLQHI
jgi:hypothetical protein